MKRARWSRPQPLKVIEEGSLRCLTCVRRVTPCMVNYLLIAAGYRYDASDSQYRVELVSPDRAERGVGRKGNKNAGSEKTRIASRSPADSLKGAAKLMAVLGTWNVIITRGDGSEYPGTVWRGHAPEPGEVVEVKAAGRPLRAQINRLIHFLPSATGPGIWRLSATETGLLLAVLRRRLLGTVSHPLSPVGARRPSYSPRTRRGGWC